MPRHPRLFIPGAIYHVYCRVARGEFVFEELDEAFEFIEKLREVLLSGGDPMVLPNRKIGQWMAALAECGVESIRLGTKEMSFHPKRFDEAFLAMIDNFHETYPEVGFRLMIHFNHPDEFLLKAEDGSYQTNPNGSLKWHPDTLKAMQGIAERGWINVENTIPFLLFLILRCL